MSRIFWLPPCVGMLSQLGKRAKKPSLIGASTWLGRVALISDVHFNSPVQTCQF